MNKALYKVGDRVRILKELDTNIPFGVNTYMRRLCGKVVKIADVEWTVENYEYKHKLVNGLWCYYIQEDGRRWKWNEYMFTDVFSKAKTLENE